MKGTLLGRSIAVIVIQCSFRRDFHQSKMINRMSTEMVMKYISSWKFPLVISFCKTRKIGSTKCLCSYNHSHCSHKATVSWNLYLLIAFIGEPRDSQWGLFYSRFLEEIRCFKILNWKDFCTVFLKPVGHAAVTTSLAQLDQLCLLDIFG